MVKPKHASVLIPVAGPPHLSDDIKIIQHDAEGELGALLNKGYVVEIQQTIVTGSMVSIYVYLFKEG